MNTALSRRIALLAFLAVAPATSVGCIAATEETDDAALEGGESAYVDEETDTREEGVSGGTVAQAVTSSCSTTSVKGLSKQIIAEARCINPDSYVLIPDLGNVSFGSAVFRYLEKPARDKLVAALKANPSRQMTVNSALRTVAQQFLLYRWYQTGRCGIGLAATPGNSNHETGLALDISQYSAWKSSLQNRGFHWLGSSDAVHFDYAGSGAVSYKGLDVKAFQRLWNRNHPNDKISTDGVWGPQTEARMKKAPAGGFAKGAQCAAALQRPPQSGDAILPDVDGAVLPDDRVDFGYPGDFEIPEVAIEESATDLAAPEALDLELIEELSIDHEAEVCGDHAH